MSLSSAPLLPTFKSHGDLPKREELDPKTGKKNFNIDQISTWGKNAFQADFTAIT